MDCKWGDWGALSACSASCGGGDRSRRRMITNEASGGGSPCIAADNLEVLPCNTQLCKDQVCSWSLWSRWDPCSVTCGGGQTKRHRDLAWTKLGSSSSQRLGSPFGKNRIEDYDANVEASVAGSRTIMRDLVSTHGPGLCALAGFGAVSMLLLAAAGISAPLRRGGQSDVQEVPGDNFALYAALGTEDPWELGAGDVERPALRPPASQGLLQALETSALLRAS